MLNADPTKHILLLSLFKIQKIVYVYVYMSAVPRAARRGHLSPLQLELQAVMRQLIWAAL